MKMDDIDYKIIKELNSNSRKRNVEIAKSICVSEGTVRQRIDRMFKNGIIKRFTIEFGVHSGLKAFILMKISTEKNTKGMITFFRSIPEIKTIFQVTGRWDCIVRVFADTSDDINRILDLMRKQSWVLETESMVVLDID